MPDEAPLTVAGGKALERRLDKLDQHVTALERKLQILQRWAEEDRAKLDRIESLLAKIANAAGVTGFVGR